MPGTVLGTAALNVAIYRVVTIATRVRNNVAGSNLFANLVEDRGGAASARCGRRVDEVPLVSDDRTNMAVRPSVFVDR